MTKYIAALLLLTSSCRQDSLVHVELCGQRCYTGDPATVGVGACSFGKYDCSAGSPVCVDDVLPSQETCDHVDNDCNGQIDEGVANCCRPTGPEVCDGIDNDCDGKVDEPEDLPVDFCYEAPRETAAHAPCRPGVRRCLAGHWTCDGQVVPTAETCDRIDNDCDGQVDEDLGGTNPVDVVFIVDDSGSMDSKLAVVKLGVQDFASRYRNHPEVRWAVIAAPADDPKLLPQNAPHLILNFSSADVFSTVIAAQQATSPSGDEPTLDALAGICDPSNPFGLTWQSGGQRSIVLLTDEEAQSTATPKNTSLTVLNSCKSAKIPIFAFVSYVPLDPVWKKIATDTGGATSNIESSELPEDLKVVINSVVCR